MKHRASEPAEQRLEIVTRGVTRRAAEPGPKPGTQIERTLLVPGDRGRCCIEQAAPLNGGAMCALALVDRPILASSCQPAAA